MQTETKRLAENELLAELCLYYLRFLCARRHKLDLDAFTPIFDSTILAGRRFTDGIVKVYRRAADVLVEAGFANEDGFRSGIYTLLTDSDGFVLDASQTVEKDGVLDLHAALFPIFLIFEDMKVLGPPDTLARIIDLIDKAGLTEMRHGHLEWTVDALARITPRLVSGQTYPERDCVWKTDLFDWYITEAASQWDLLRDSA